MSAVPHAALVPTGAGSPVRRRVIVRGAVQGVGFRPFVYRAATARGLAGWVRNGGDGVILEVEGDAAAVADLMEILRRSPPPNARVTALDVTDVAVVHAADFAIHESAAAGAATTQILPDLATCDACLAELRDPANRRHRYPFINCTACGPRYSIVEGIPYDRARTSMRRFALCPDCRAEYDDPADRRFHAEPNACPVCGPQLALWDGAGTVLATRDAALQAAGKAIRDGGIVAVKGIGGFHLFADSRNDEAVRRLRARKRREEKPFAVMFPDLDAVKASCRVDDVAAGLLTGPARPIVLLPRSGGPVAPAVAPDNPRLGALLPYAPVHHLLLDDLGFPVVATSGNVSDEPIVTDEQEAPERLAGIADLFLVHDRPIVRPVDDSVVQIVYGRPQVLRRARGYVPEPLDIGWTADGILAVGGHLKAAVALGHGTSVIVSQHLGDLDGAAARAVHRTALNDLQRLHDRPARRVVRDRHPDYASTFAAENTNLPATAVQHHVAHAAACLAEHGLVPPALGVAWDGVGYGSDGTIWGGEFLHLTEHGWRRAAHLRPFPLPGGTAAVREPRRAALGLLYAAYGADALAMTDLPPVAAFSAAERDVLRRMLNRGVQTPLASSMGRLFDAAAALCGLCQRSRHEGQAAMLLEWRAAGRDDGRAYPFPLCRAADLKETWVVDWQPALDALLAELRAGVGIDAISDAFHRGLAEAVVTVAERVGERRVALTGGCFQNVRLTETAVAALRAAGFEPVWHERIPPNDGALAFGQAAWTAWMDNRETTPCA